MRAALAHKRVGHLRGRCADQLFPAFTSTIYSNTLLLFPLLSEYINQNSHILQNIIKSYYIVYVDLVVLGPLIIKSYYIVYVDLVVLGPLAVQQMTSPPKSRHQ